MRQVTSALFVLVVGLAAIAQDAAPAQPQLTQVPPKPSCTQLFKTGTCADLWRAYNQALAQRRTEELQLYVNRQKEIASSQAAAQTAAPLQQQIGNLNKQIADLNALSADQQGQIKKLQQEMQADSVAALQAKSDAHTQGMEQGGGIGAGAMLLLVGIIFGAKKLTGSRTAKPLARSTSA